MKMSVDFSDKKFRSTFDLEKRRLTAAINDCEALDKTLNETCEGLRGSMTRNRGAASLLCRMTEQLIANRNHRLALVKELRALKKDIIEREIKLAEKTVEASKDNIASGVTHALLDRLQAIILVPGASASLMEPDFEETASSEVSNPDIPELSSDINIGDIVSDGEGNLWVINEDGAEQLGVKAAEMHTEDNLPFAYAVTEDGRHVLIVDIDQPD